MLGALAFIFDYFRANDQELARLNNFTMVQFTSIMALYVLGTIIRSLEMKYILARLNTIVGMLETTALIVYTTILNYVPMNAGLFVRANILKQHKSLPYASYIALMSAITLLTMMTASLLGLLSLGLALNAESQAMATNSLSARYLLVSLFLVGILIPLAIIYSPARLLKRHQGWWQNRLQTMLLGLNQLRGNALVTTGVFAAFKLLMIAGRFWICFKVISLECSFQVALLFSAVTSLLLVVNLTPGGLGVRELLTASLAELVGMDFSDGLLAASLDRVVGIIFLAITGIPSFAYVNSNFIKKPGTADL